LIDLRDELGRALRLREDTLGPTAIMTIGSVQRGCTTPHDIDLKVNISRSLDDPSVRDAAEEAIRVVIRAKCFDGQTALIFEEYGVWQWPLDVCISDGTKKLYLMAIGTQPGGMIQFYFDRACAKNLSQTS
jgi:hypothetical protein